MTKKTKRIINDLEEKLNAANRRIDVLEFLHDNPSGYKAYVTADIGCSSYRMFVLFVKETFDPFSGKVIKTLERSTSVNVSEDFYSSSKIITDTLSETPDILEFSARGKKDDICKHFILVKDSKFLAPYRNERFY